MRTNEQIEHEFALTEAEQIEENEQAYLTQMERDFIDGMDAEYQQWMSTWGRDISEDERYRAMQVQPRVDIIP